MSDALQAMQVKRIEDAADRFAYAPLAGAQVYGQAGTLPGPPVGRLVPYQQNGAWWITPGYVEGTRIDGSGEPLPALQPGMKVYVGCTVDREGKVLEADTEEGSDFEYLTGAYTIDRAFLETYEEGELPVPEVNFPGTATTFKLLFTCDEDGLPPASVTGRPHYQINSSSLTF